MTAQFKTRIVELTSVVLTDPEDPSTTVQVDIDTLEEAAARSNRYVSFKDFGLKAIKIMIKLGWITTRRSLDYHFSAEFASIIWPQIQKDWAEFQADHDPVTEDSIETRVQDAVAAERHRIADALIAKYGVTNRAASDIRKELV